MENARPAATDAHRGPGLPLFSSASFAQERARLARICERLTGGNAVAAEDLVQETLLVAWRQARQGRTPQDWQPYLVGIARRLCLHWRSQNAQRRDLSFHSDPDEAAGYLPALAASDPLAALLHAERAQLIDRAFAQIDPDARTLLVAYYIDERPLSQIAGSLGLTENATAVRMHRSREALTRALAAGSLRDEAAAHGLLSGDAAAGWGATRLWCPRCGRLRLQGRFTTAATGTSPERGGYDYALRCADCDRHGGPPLGFTSAALPMEGAAVLEGVQGYRAAFKRLHRWWEVYVDRGLTTRRVECVHCGRPTPVLTFRPGVDGTPVSPGFFTHCGACAGLFFIAPGGLLFHAAPLRTFWQAHPRVRFLPEKRVRCEGREAALVGFADRQSGARLEMVFALDDLRPLRVLKTD